LGGIFLLSGFIAVALILLVWGFLFALLAYIYRWRRAVGLGLCVFLFCLEFFGAYLFYMNFSYSL
jgi:hypothetical protein